jgi:hypothetical protein
VLDAYKAETTMESGNRIFAFRLISGQDRQVNGLLREAPQQHAEWRECTPILLAAGTLLKSHHVRV